jgi:hypothetical protein
MLRAFFISNRAHQSSWRLLNSSFCRPHLSPCCRTIVSDRRIHSNALIVTEDLTNKVFAWATEVARTYLKIPDCCRSAIKEE